MTRNSSKSDLITWIATLQENAPELVAVEGIRHGEANTRNSTAGCALQIGKAAARAGVSRMTIYRALAAGALRAAPLYRGGRRRILETDLETWLRGNGGAS